MIKKIQKQLEEESLRDFMSFLQQTLSKTKMDRIKAQTDTLVFRKTVLLRDIDESYDTIQLQLKGSKLVKQLDKGALPFWVVDAFVRPPKYLDLGPYRSTHLIDVYSFLCHSEVLASSPLIE